MITINDVKDFLKENSEQEEVQNLFQSISDKRVSAAIETYKAKHEQEKLNELQAQIETLQAEKQSAQLMDVAREKGVPENLLSLVIGQDEKETLKKSEELLTGFTDALEKKTAAEVNKRLGNPAPTNGLPLSNRDYRNMSAEEIAALPEKEYNTALNTLNTPNP